MKTGQRHLPTTVIHLPILKAVQQTHTAIAIAWLHLSVSDFLSGCASLDEFDGLY
jgi:hypothetical protein